MWLIDPIIIIARFLVGLVVGISGVGGGALMTPFLVFYGIPPAIRFLALVIGILGK